MLRSYFGLTLLEILIVVAVIAVIAAMVALNGRRVLQGQEARAAVTSLQQSVWQGATAAAARGVVTRLTRTGDVFTLTDTAAGIPLRRFELPSGVSTNWGDGQSLDFLPPGRLDVDTLDALPNPLTVTANGRTTALVVSLIGEVRAVTQ